MIRYVRDSVLRKLSPHDRADMAVIGGKLHRLVHKFRGGPDALARILGYDSGQILRNEVELHGSGMAKPGFLDVLLWVRASHDFTLLDAVDEFVGRTPVTVSVDDRSFHDHMTDSLREGSEFQVSAMESISDGRITEAELMELEREGAEAIEQIQKVIDKAKTICGEGGRV